MWKYHETNAWNSISIHDCRTDDIQIEGNDLIVNFHDGFWIAPCSPHIDHDVPLKTGPAQLCFCGLGQEIPMDFIDLFKTTHLFGKPLFCRRIQPETPAFLAMINSGKYQLEFLYEFHNGLSSLYQCWIWRKGKGMYAECQMELTAKSIEYRWNEITDEEW